MCVGGGGGGSVCVCVGGVWEVSVRGGVEGVFIHVHVRINTMTCTT